jgi:uncharacterized membrane protein (UPF0182 family)
MLVNRATILLVIAQVVKVLAGEAIALKRILVKITPVVPEAVVLLLLLLSLIVGQVVPVGVDLVRLEHQAGVLVVANNINKPKNWYFQSDSFV